MKHHHRPAVLKMMAMRTLPRLLRHLQAAHLARFLGDWGVHTLAVYNRLSLPCNSQMNTTTLRHIKNIVYLTEQF
jgi:hypothetical protein